MTARRRRHRRKQWARMHKRSSQALRALAALGNPYAAGELRRRLRCGVAAHVARTRRVVVTYSTADDPAVRARAVGVIRGIIQRTRGAAS